MYLYSYSWKNCFAVFVFCFVFPSFCVPCNCNYHSFASYQLKEMYCFWLNYFICLNLSMLITNIIDLKNENGPHSCIHFVQHDCLYKHVPIVTYRYSSTGTIFITGEFVPSYDVMTSSKVSLSRHVLSKYLNIQNVSSCVHNNLCCRLDFYVNHVFGGILLKRLDGVGQGVQQAKNRYSLTNDVGSICKATYFSHVWYLCIQL